MADSEKRVVFTAQDQVSQKATQMYNTILAAAKKQTDNLKEQNSLIDKQLKSLEKKVQLENKLGEGHVEGLFNNARRQEPGLQQQRAAKEAIAAKSAFATTKADNEKLLDLVSDLLRESKKTNTLTDKANKETQKKGLTAEAQYQSQLSLWKQEIREDKIGVKSRIKAGEKTGYENLDPRQAEKLMYQKSIVGGDEKSGKSLISQIIGGIIVGGVIQQAAQAMATLTHATSGEQGFNSLLGMVPVAGGFLSGGASRTFDQQYGVRSKELALSSLTGKSILGNGNTDIGFSTLESLGLTEGFIKARGSAKGSRQTDEGMLLQRGLNLSTEQLVQIVKDTRTARSGAEMSQIIANIIHSNPELRKDQTKLSEVLAQSSQLTNTLAQQTENIPKDLGAGMIGALRSIGGSFALPGLAESRMMSINSSLTNPGTDYQKARSFGVLSSLHPGSSYFEMLENQEQGIGSKGYLTATLKQLKKETGGSQNYMLAIMQNLGLQASTSRLLAGANPDKFKNFTGGNEDLDKMLGLTKRASTNTATRDREKAEIDNAYLDSAAAGDLKVAALTFTAAVNTLKEYLKGDKPGSEASPQQRAANKMIEAADIQLKAANTQADSARIINGLGDKIDQLDLDVNSVINQ